MDAINGRIYVSVCVCLCVCVNEIPTFDILRAYYIENGWYLSGHMCNQRPWFGQ